MRQWAVLFGCVWWITGCVSQSTYEQAISEQEALKSSLEARIAESRVLQKELEEEKRRLEGVKRRLGEDIERLKQEAAALEARNAQIVLEKDAAERALREKDQAMKDKLSELRSVFSQELEESSVRIEMLRSDIKVDLSDDILYASGQANLTPAGVEVIKKVAKQLANTPYMIRVIGNTDSVPIRGTLAMKYPTNWELAAARAVGVVRLLQENGVRPENMEAVSRAEYYPVADNESPEGRAKNRRTEILLRVQ